jgi:dienelactone hydrolase
MRSQRHAALIVAGVFALLCHEMTNSWAQKPPPPGPGNPQAPTLAMPMPMGMQRGTSMVLQFTGSNLAGPTGVLSGFPAKITIPTENNNGQDNATLKVRFDVSADAPVGVYPLRLATTRGISGVRLFCIDELPQVTAIDGNHQFDTAQRVAFPCVVVGRVGAETGEYYKITVPAGQRLSFDVLGRRLGSPIDPQISIYHAQTKRELAHDNDSPGCQTDPRLTYVFKVAGDYVIQVKDVLNRLGPDFVYRLRIGDFPLATVPIPMAAKRGTKATVHFAGPHVEGVAPVDVDVPADPETTVVWVAPKGASGLHGWPVALLVSDMDEGLEREPNNTPAQANRISVPGAVTGRFEKSDDTDCYIFSAKKGQKITVEAQTLELYSPTLVYMVLRNAKTKAELAKTNPQSPPPADQRLDFTAPEDGDYVVEVQHLNYVGGPNEAYHLVISPTLPGFDVTLPLDRYDLAPDSFVPLNLNVNRRGYTGPIEISVVGARRGASPLILTGSTTIKAGQNNGALIVRAAAGAPMGPTNALLQAQATIDGKKITQWVSVKNPISASLSGLPFPPLDLNYRVAFAVKEKAPFALALTMDPPEAVIGKATQVTVSVTRSAGFTEAVNLNGLTGLPANVTAGKLTAIPKDKNEVKFKLDVNAKAVAGESLIFLSGNAKAQGKEYSANAQPFNLRVVTKATEAAGYPAPAQVKAAFLKLLDRPKVEPDIKSDGGKKQGDDFVLEHLTFASQKKADDTMERVPMLIFKPAQAKERLPAVLVLHGTGGNMAGQIPIMKELAKQGIIGVAIDARYHGERSGGAKGAAAYNQAIIRAWKTKPGEPMEHPFYFDTVWDIWRTLDVLSQRDDIDATRLGMIGFSMGGIETWLAAAVDERVKVVVPAIGVQSFRYSLENEKWQGRANTIKEAHAVAAKDLGEAAVNQKVCRELWNKVIPGMLDQFDCPSMLRLFAGRSLLILNGTEDPNCPIEGAKIAIASAERAFKDAKAADKLRVIIEPVGHTVTNSQRAAALEWFKRGLAQ